MDPNRRLRRRSFVGPVVLICIGVFFLIANLVPSFNPWEVMLRYWPVILILVGLGKVWDYYSVRRYPNAPGSSDVSGIVIAAVLLLLLLLALGLWRSEKRVVRNDRDNVQTIDLQGATAVTANLKFPAGELNVRGGSDRLLNADFRYDTANSPPQLDYTVDAAHGELNVSEKGDEAHFGTTDDRWNLQFNDGVPLDLTLDMGAGQSNLALANMNLTHLQVHLGAGQVMLDLTGARKQDLSVDIQGGVGQARIKLPRDVGVRAHASGGIGTISAHGLTKEGDEYTNAVYGKTPTLIDLNVHGGIGEIDLDQE